MTAPAHTVTAYFNAVSSNIFTLGHPTKGVLGSAYVLGTDAPINITSYVRSISMQRGKSRMFDAFQTGTCSIELNNSTRAFDPLYSAGPYFGSIVPGKRFTVAIAGVVIFDGKVESYKYGYSRNQVPIATVTLIDALGTLATRQIVGWTTTAGQTDADRLLEMLARPEISFGASVAVDAGLATLQADTVSDNTNALQYGQLVARSAFARFYASKDNVLTYRNRRANLNAGPSVTFANTGGSAIKFASVERLSGTDFLWNYVVTARRGGATQIFQDTESQTLYGLRAPTDDLGFSDLIVDTDAQAYDYGLYLASNYSTPEDRFSAFQIRIHALTPTQQQTVAGLDMSSIIRATWTPGGIGSAIDRYCIVEGIQYQAARNSSVFTVRVGDAINRQAFVLDDPVFGLLDGQGTLVF